MKNETLNGILTFVLGALVVAGVICALRVYNVTHESRVLQNMAINANNNLMVAQALLNDTANYNKKYPSPQLNSLLQSVQARPVNR
jgi:hypothetical protein